MTRRGRPEPSPVRIQAGTCRARTRWAVFATLLLLPAPEAIASTPAIPTTTELRNSLTAAFPPRSACFESAFEAVVWGHGSKAPADQHGGVPYQRTLFHLATMPDWVLLKGQQTQPGDPDGERSPARSAMWRDGVAWAREEANPAGDTWITTNALEGLFTLHQAWTFNGIDAHYPTHSRLFGSLDHLQVAGVSTDGEVTHYQLQHPDVDPNLVRITLAVGPVDGITRPLWHSMDVRTADGPFHTFLCEFFDWRTTDGITLPWGARRSSWSSSGDTDVGAAPAPARYKTASPEDQSHCTTYRRTSLSRCDPQEMTVRMKSAAVPKHGELVWHEHLSLSVRVGDPEVNLDGVMWAVAEPPTGSPPEDLHEFMRGAVQIDSAYPPRREADAEAIHASLAESRTRGWLISTLTLVAGCGFYLLASVLRKRRAKGVQHGRMDW